MSDTNWAVPALEHEFDVVVELGEVADYGVTRAGHRRVVSIVGGTVTGTLEGTIVPGGADWQIVRDDGAVEIDGRYSVLTGSGALVYLQVNGVRVGGGSDGSTYFRTTVHVETSDPALSRLQDCLLVASCVRDASGVRYGAYRVT